MKTLYLIRHGKSSWDDPSLPDSKRPLNSRGRRDSPIMGQRLQKRKIIPDLLVSSPASRARETSLLIAESVGYPKSRIIFDQNIYNAGVPTLLQVIEGFPGSVSSAFLIGHNPGLTSLAEHLTETSIGNLPTCGIAAIELGLESWVHLSGGLGKLIFIDYPKKDFPA